MGVAMAALPVISAVAGIAGAGVSAYGAIKQGQSASDAYAYKAQVAANNAAIGRQRAVQEIQAGEIAAVNQGLKTRAKVASEKAQQGAAGIDVNTGSAAMVREGTAELGMLDALTIRSNAAKKAWAAQVDATSSEAQAQLDRAAGENAETSGYINAAGSLLSGASTVGGSYAKWQTNYGGTSGGSAADMSYAEKLGAGLIPV
jgi:hypothetical protein